MAAPVTVFTLTSFFSEVPELVKKGLKSYAANHVNSVAVQSEGMVLLIKGNVQAPMSMKEKNYTVRYFTKKI